MKTLPIPVQRYLVPPQKPAMPEGFTQVDVRILTGLPCTIPLTGDLQLIVVLPTGLAVPWRDSDATAIASSSENELRPVIHQTAPELRFVVQGTVTLGQTQRGIVGLKVSVWDKDVRISDQLGTAITDDNGNFSIRFDSSRFADHPLDNLPDVFFLIYQNNRVIHSTESHPIKNAQDLLNVIIAVDLPVGPLPPPDPDYFVQGTLRNRRTKEPLVGFQVEAWDKDVRISDQLGIATTDQKGRFSLTYDASCFEDEPDNLPDVFFRIFVGDKLVYTTESHPIKNTPKIRDLVLEIDIPLDDDKTPFTIGDVTRAPFRLVVQQFSRTIGIVPLVAGFRRVVPDSGASNLGGQIELVILEWNIQVGSVRGAGDFGSRLSLAWRRANQAAVQFSPPPINPMLISRLQS